MNKILHLVLFAVCVVAFFLGFISQHHYTWNKPHNFSILLEPPLWSHACLYIGLIGGGILAHKWDNK